MKMNRFSAIILTKKNSKRKYVANEFVYMFLIGRRIMRIPLGWVDCAWGVGGGWICWKSGIVMRIDNHSHGEPDSMVLRWNSTDYLYILGVNHGMNERNHIFPTIHPKSIETAYTSISTHFVVLFLEFTGISPLDIPIRMANIALSLFWFVVC